ncbi:DsbA family protein [Streptomyces thermolilacinus]|uniref:Disulfide bond formation protein DsbA n=1 Tax=Streptomyces thermolilacinus SPC6 TaxID=1306406 RepID=A0A1D3DSJ8_9ACTN|nr:DsbA family protein [Streptomyces thermolilacinus]OEJ95299.1 disulfide bond formation protein DsbA [Streptomyces thermolilacinus SPC6]
MSTNPSPSSSSSSSASLKPYAIGAGVAVAAGLLAFASYAATKPADRDATEAAPAAPVSAPASAPSDAAPSAAPGAQEGLYAEAAKLARRDAKDTLAAGRADAPVVLIEYADFQCGYCGKFARDTEPALMEKYVEKGVLRIEWRNFPIFGEDSERVARAAWAAGQQGRFWEFHRAAYAEDAKEKGFGKDQLTVLAREAGVKDLARFGRDLDGAAARQAVKRDQDEGFALGVASTPSFLINGRPVSGAQPLETFTAAIDEAAAKAKAGR